MSDGENSSDQREEHDNDLERGEGQRRADVLSNVSVDSETWSAQLEKLSRRCRCLAIWAGLQALFLRIVNVIGTLFIIGAGVSVGIISLFQNQTLGYVVASLGFSITGVKSLLSIFSAESRAISLKQISIRLRRIRAEIAVLPAGDEVTLASYATEIDNLAMSIYYSGPVDSASNTG